MKGDTKKGLFSQVKSNPYMTLLTIVLIACVVLMGFIIYQLFTDAQKDQRALQLTGDLRASSYQITSLARDSTGGNAEAFAQLQSVINGMERSWGQLSNLDAHTAKVLETELENFGNVWSRVKGNSEIITNNQEPITLLHKVANDLDNSIPALQREIELIVEVMLESTNNVSANQVVNVQGLDTRAERIGRNVEKMLAGGSDAKAAADQFNPDATYFKKALAAMKLGEGGELLRFSKVTDAEAVESLDRIIGRFELVGGSIDNIVTSSPSLFSAVNATESILNDGPLVLQSLGELSDKIGTLPESRNINDNILLLVGSLALLVFILMAWQLNQTTSKRALATGETNERNQNAILRLLDELADLADGDLTTTATVTEDFTGAIADSINYTIDQLRVLVSRINETSERVASGSSDTQQTALHLAEASEHQAQEIAGASAAVNEMAVTIDQVSANAAESAGVAERSVSIAKNGAKVVQNTIHGMDTIREQIQDTAKRIKRLGESSQEIGDIVSLINDIADQTNILALNAAIQASMAGDAGRGFAVVADEVQRLAERSATATKQIEALVKTIQNDTNEAVISMEQTTSEVVRGARLAQDAGVALEEIETVSANLAELIQNISNAARQQASSAGHISNTMNVIQEITSQTSAGTNATAKAIGNLAETAIDLRNSVTGFKLPEEMQEDFASVKEDFAEQSTNQYSIPEEEVVNLAVDSSLEEDDFIPTLEDEQSAGARV